MSRTTAQRNWCRWNMFTSFCYKSDVSHLHSCAFSKSIILCVPLILEQDFARPLMHMFHVNVTLCAAACAEISCSHTLHHQRRFYLVLPEHISLCDAVQQGVGDLTSGAGHHNADWFGLEGNKQECFIKANEQTTRNEEHVRTASSQLCRLWALATKRT